MISKESLKKLNGVHIGKEILFQLEELNKLFSWNEIEDFITQTGASVLHHDGNSGHLVLKNFGLQGYFLAVPVEKYRELQ